MQKIEQSAAGANTAPPRPLNDASHLTTPCSSLGCSVVVVWPAKRRARATPSRGSSVELRLLDSPAGTLAPVGRVERWDCARPLRTGGRPVTRPGALQREAATRVVVSARGGQTVVQAANAINRLARFRWLASQFSATADHVGFGPCLERQPRPEAQPRRSEWSRRARRLDNLVRQGDCPA
jgi:hypothetical protein